jgi:phosphatidate phosphatase PAH1
LINFGLSDGKVVLTDIGELFFGKEMEDQIKKRPWVKPYVLRFLLMKHRDYFIRRMDELFLNEVLEKGNLI